MTTDADKATRGRSERSAQLGRFVAEGLVDGSQDTYLAAAAEGDEEYSDVFDALSQ